MPLGFQVLGVVSRPVGVCITHLFHGLLRETESDGWGEAQ